MSVLTRVMVIGAAASIGLLIGGTIGLQQGVSHAVSSWLQIIMGAASLTSICVVGGASAIQKKRSALKSRNDT